MSPEQIIELAVQLVGRGRYNDLKDAVEDVVAGAEIASRPSQPGQSRDRAP